MGRITQNMPLRLPLLLWARNGAARSVAHESYTFAARHRPLVNVGVFDAGESLSDGLGIGADLGSATTLQLGDAGDDDRYLAATVFTTADRQRFALRWNAWIQKHHDLTDPAGSENRHEEATEP